MLIRRSKLAIKPPMFGSASARMGVSTGVMYGCGPLCYFRKENNS